MNTPASRPLAVVTGASAGIGLELARLCVESGHDLLIAADQPEIHEAAERFRAQGAAVDAVHVDLATPEGVDELVSAIGARPVEVLMANAGHGLGKGFLDQAFEDARHVIDTNVTGTLYLLHRVVRDMRARGRGRVLITGSVAGYMPGTFQAVYNGTKAFIDSFAIALRHELDGSGVSVTLLMPGPTDTEFFERADLMDTRIGQGSKDDPAMVARVGFEAMMKGESDVVAGLKNKLQTAVASITPVDALAELHRKQAEPGSGTKQ